ncbi:MAG TPA: discoidin domain-containing protein [Thermoanaerobaculia bacterium]|nr:discoidin domain-containing protein [Thermoanaerobaculia bacterium]
MKHAAAAALVFLAFACKREPPPPPPTPPPAAAPTQQERDAQAGTDIDADNLLNIAYGANVVSRTGESHLESSAIHAIDGFSPTSWASPPSGARQTIVFSLASRARIERLGITAFKESTPGKIRFDASLDGKHWRQIVVQNAVASNATQLVDVKPFEARYLRVETIDPASSYSYFRSVHAIGAEVAPPAPRTFAGTWTINNAFAHFEQNGARITGFIHGDPIVFIDGGVDDRVARVTWHRGPVHGYAILSTDPDTHTLSGLTLYDEIATQNVGEAWFGVASRGELSVRPADLNPGARFTMYGLAFDKEEHLLENLSRSTLDEAAQRIAGAAHARFRITSYELRLDHPKERTAARVASIRAALQKRGVDLSRIDFVAAGDQWKGPPIITAVQRVLGSRVDLERVGR